jgi:membrane-associated phospholipid phosphatase
MSQSMSDRGNIILMIVAAGAFVALALVAMTVGIPTTVQFFNNRWFYSAVLGTCVVHFFKSDDQSERATLLFFGAVFILAGWSFASFFASRLCMLVFASALASIFTYLRVLAQKKRSAADIIRTAAPAWLVVVATCASSMFLLITPSFTPTIYDTYLFLFEQQLGLKVASLANMLLAEGPKGTEILLLYVYEMLPLAVALHYAVYEDSKMPLLLVVSGSLGAILYPLYPAIGPELTISGYYDSIFPSSALELPNNPAEIQAAPRNAMPSLHATWGYLFLWNSSPRRRLAQLLFFIFGLLTIVSAFDIGRHWFIDLIVALPFAASVHGICANQRPWRDPKRILIVAGGAILTAAWLLLLRSSWLVSHVPMTLGWVAIICTSVASIYLVRQMGSSRNQTRFETALGSSLITLAR